MSSIREALGGIERPHTTKPISWRSVVGLVLVPLIIAGVFVAALWNPFEHTDRVTAAIVNEDQPVTISGQLTPIGRAFAGNLVDAKQNNYTWVLTNKQDAADGLKSGTYAAIVTIPKNFSRAATSTGAKNPVDAKQATLQVQTSHRSALIDDAVSTAISSAAAGAMSEQISKTYLENIYVGFNTLHGAMADAHAGATSLVNGTTKLSTGAQSAADAVTQLSGGLSQLSTGTDQLSGGLSQLSTGASGVASGAGALASGASAVSTGAHGVASGTSTVAKSNAALSLAISQLYGSATAPTTGLADGTRALAAGLGTLSTTVSDPVEGLDTTTKGLQGGTAEVLSGIDGVHACLTQASTLLDSISTGSMTPTEQANLTRVKEILQGVVTTTAGAAPSTTCPTTAAETTLRGAANATAQGATELNDAVAPDDPTDTDPGLVAAIQHAARSADTLSVGVNSIDPTGTKPGLIQALSLLNGSAKQLSTGAATLSSGAQTLATGANGLATGASSLSTGAQTLASGASKSSSAASQIATATGTAATGSQQLATGSRDLANGVSSLETGTKKLQSGLATGVSKIPTYTKAQRAHLSSVAATPVTQTASVDTAFGNGNLGFYFAIALWIGAIATFVLMRALPSKLVQSSKSSLTLAVQGLRIPAIAVIVQSLLLSLLLVWSTGIGWRYLAPLAAIGVVAACAFAAVNQALLALFGGTGRVLAVIFAAVNAAAAIFTGVPSSVATFASFLPAGAAIRAIQSVTAGAPGAGSAIVALLVWAIVALTASVIVVARRRTTTLARLAVAE